MMYRACLAKMHLNQNLFDMNYLTFTKDSSYSNILSEGNPFLIKRHFIKLMDVVDQTKNKSLTEPQFAIFFESIKKLMNDLDSLSPQNCAAFKSMMKGYSNLLLAKFMDYNLPESKKNPTSIKELLDTANKSFQLAQYIQEEEHDISISLYANSDFPPPLPFKNLNEALAKTTELKHALTAESENKPERRNFNQI